MTRRRAIALVLALLVPLAAGATCFRTPQPDLARLPAPLDRQITRTEAQLVAETVARRCVVCHGCYDAPCQVVLQSREGLERGANKAPVYRSSRLLAAEPTRLGLDAQTVEGWRELGFFSITDVDPRQQMSLIGAMLALGEAHDFTPDHPLPQGFPLDLDRALACPTSDEFAGYADRNPMGGMPYGTASLSHREYEVLGTWASSEAPVPPSRPYPPELVEEAAEWERLLNGESLKERVVARYLYEHWVFAHLWFENHPEGPFFEVVRSRTPPGEPIDVIATRFPFEDPGVDRFWYRLREYDAIIVHKTHITYRLGPGRRARLGELFFGEDWEATFYPSWDPEKASNPFVSFEEIPSRARYQFLLDDAEYFVRTFIRGPVCHGQAATDVIQDRFFVAFLDPDHDVSIVDPDFLPEVKAYLRLPAEAGANMTLFQSFARYDLAQKRYRDRRAEAYARMLRGRGPDLDFIWDGDGTDRDAMLTVFRHHDNASVVTGFVGAVPKTAWVMDFPVFERIYYDLVAGFDVFGRVGHQLAVRFYMDNLRMESEDLFLAFLPEGVREPLRASWYIGATRQIEYTVVNQMRSKGMPSGIPFRTDDPKAELIGMLVARNPEVSGPPDWINRCPEEPCERPGATPLELVAERELRRLSTAQGPFARELPEVSLLRVRGPGGALANYTLIHDRSHTNVAAIFREEARLQPELDRVTVVPGFLGSYPNFAFEVESDEMDAFVDAILAGGDPGSLTRLASRWGVRRTSPRFWPYMDWMHDEMVRENAREAGILDLNRFQNL